MNFAEHFRSRNWGETALGEAAQWPSALARSVQDMDRSSEPMFLVVGSDFVFLFNEAFADLIGPAWPSALALPLQQVVGSDWPAVEPLVQRAIGGEAFIAPHLNPRSWVGQEGRDMACIAAFAPVRDDQGDVLAAWGICRVANKGGGRDADRPRGVGHLSAVEAFGSIVAHELNQPLAAIANYARVANMLLRENATSNERLNECMEGISAAANNAGIFIRSMRESLRKGPPRLEELELRHVAECAIKSASADCAENVLFVVSVPSSLKVVADRMLIEQVFGELLKNAYESVGSSKVTVSAEVEGDAVRTTVEDDGSGLGGATSADPFAPFESSKEGALGLGLPICRTIVEAQGGKIAIGNGSPVGARVCFTLPKSRTVDAHQSCDLQETLSPAN